MMASPILASVKVLVIILSMPLGVEAMPQSKMTPSHYRAKYPRHYSQKNRPVPIKKLIFTATVQFESLWILIFTAGKFKYAFLKFAIVKIKWLKVKYGFGYRLRDYHSYLTRLDAGSIQTPRAEGESLKMELNIQFWLNGVISRIWPHRRLPFPGLWSDEFCLKLRCKIPINDYEIQLHCN